MPFRCVVPAQGGLDPPILTQNLLRYFHLEIEPGLTYIAYVGVYLSRKPISVVKTTMIKETDLSSSDFALIETSFMAAYMVGQVNACCTPFIRSPSSMCHVSANVVLDWSHLSSPAPKILPRCCVPPQRSFHDALRLPVDACGARCGVGDQRICPVSCKPLAGEFCGGHIPSRDAGK